MRAATPRAVRCKIDFGRLDMPGPGEYIVSGYSTVSGYKMVLQGKIWGAGGRFTTNDL
jgi:hypothetical protein